MSKRKTTIGFVAIIDPVWLAGTKYLINLWRALRTASTRQYEFVLLVSETVSPQEYNLLIPCVDRVVIYPPSTKKSIPLLVINKIHKQFFHKLDTYLRDQGVDVMFSPLDSGARSIPRIHWLPDFQHLYYPEFFTLSQLASRAKAYPSAAEKATIVVVSSNAAKSDLVKLLPTASDKIRVLSFASQLPQRVFDDDPVHTADFYHLPARFFFLPNQFWKHKNHRVVLDALQIAHKTEPELTVVCTGATFDSRDPQYFDTLLARVSALNLHRNLRILGRVPEEHLYQLMRRSLAILQPSLFEGWNTSVEEAKSLGKTVILSEIPVHREQSPPGARYFRPDDAPALAKIMIDVYARGNPGPDPQAEEQARHSMLERVCVFAQAFDAIVEQALHENGRR
ncbi:MAG: glycosyltransferase family 4 protein [Chloroflexota bacterium]